MVNDKVVMLKQVPTVWNVADIGTKCLAQQRLMVLMHETGLVFVDSGESVGAEEHGRQTERSGNQRQLQRLAKTILRMSVAMGLEPVGAMGQTCDPKDQRETATSSFLDLVCSGFHVHCDACDCGFFVAKVEGAEI